MCNVSTCKLLQLTSYGVECIDVFSRLVLVKGCVVSQLLLVCTNVEYVSSKYSNLS